MPRILFRCGDRRILEQKNALHLPLSTLDVFAYTLEESFHTEYQYDSAPFDLLCFLGISVNENILAYDLTETILRSHFGVLTIHQFTHLYQRPTYSLTLGWLNRKFGQFLVGIE